MVLLLATCLPSGPGATLLADQFLGLKWIPARARYRINPSFPETEFAGTREQQVELIRCAARVWTDQTRVDFRFIFDGTTDLKGFMADEVSTLAWINTDGNGALAATCISGSEGAFTDFDVVFFGLSDGFKVHWSGPGEPTPDTWDIRGIATHELGHGLGIDHVEEPEATMFFQARNGGLELRTLHEVDHRCVETLYDLRTPELPGVDLVSMAPNSGPTTGANEAVIRGLNFTWNADTRILVAGKPLDADHWEVETCDLIRISRMPSHGLGPVEIGVRNSLGVDSVADFYEYVGAPLVFRRSDASADGKVDITDALTILGVLFLGVPRRFECEKSGDANDSGVVDITDALHVLGHLFLGGPAPPEPFPGCGSEHSRDDLSCDSYPSC